MGDNQSLTLYMASSNSGTGFGVNDVRKKDIKSKIKKDHLKIVNWYSLFYT
jgi:hypothetical protein